MPRTQLIRGDARTINLDLASNSNCQVPWVCQWYLDVTLYQQPNWCPSGHFYKKGSEIGSTQDMVLIFVEVDKDPSRVLHSRVLQVSLHGNTRHSFSSLAFSGLKPL